MSARSLESTLASHRIAERQRALRALLLRPLMTSTDPDFVAVRSHADELRPWLMRETGWVLHVERDSARLFKRPADLLDSTRGVPGFDRRRYVLLSLACAVLERAEAQITLKSLGDELMRMAADPALAAAGFRFALDQAHERRDLVHVCRFLVGSGALARVTGDEEAFVNQAYSQSTDALYDVHRRTLSGLLACVRGPSTYTDENEPKDLDARLASLAQEPQLDSADAHRTALRHALARRLLDDPVVYLDELDAETREYFAGQRGPLAARLAEAADLVVEQRAEGVALIDPEGELSDVQLPAEGTLSHATLLVAEYLAKELRAEPARFIPEPEIALFVRRAADTFGRYWRKAEREPGSENALARETLGELEKLRLISFQDGKVRARPALARYALGEPRVRSVEQLSLIGTSVLP
jgi:uncharacterized protein (TIGR02678 family)